VIEQHAIMAQALSDISPSGSLSHDNARNSELRPIGSCSGQQWSRRFARNCHAAVIRGNFALFKACLSLSVTYHRTTLISFSILACSMNKKQMPKRRLSERYYRNLRIFTMSCQTEKKTWNLNVSNKSFAFISSVRRREAFSGQGFRTATNGNTG
jgi:hypothetical protein